jgi:Outer membrane protein beta-barrel domain
MLVRRMVQMVAVCMISSLSVAADAQAQNAQTRQGFWFSGGLGYGSLGCNDGCDSREGSLSADISLGGTISPRLLVGVGTSAWSKSENGGTLTVGILDARVRFYPSARGGMFLTGGIGVGSVQAKVGGLTATESGVGAILGLGYDYRVSQNMSITPYWNAFAMKNDYMDANVGQAGIAITLH